MTVSNHFQNQVLDHQPYLNRLALKFTRNLTDAEDLVQETMIKLLQSESKLDQWLNLFYFSVQTITTVGYGRIAPLSHFASIVSSIESFFGVLGFAFASGITYGRYARPQAKIIFSDKLIRKCITTCIFTPYIFNAM